jgi:hypothetical protein
MTASDILNNQNQIIACAKSFRHDANWLMHELSLDFNFSLDSTSTFPIDIYKHKYNSKGIFRDEWIYYFHGAECRFENSITGQVIEMIITTKPEFGFLDGNFLYNYMTTTEKFKPLARWFENPLNVWTALEILADKNKMKRDHTVSIKRNIVAR